MSSRSPTVSEENDILVIGGSWSGPIFAHALARYRHPARLLTLRLDDSSASPAPGTLAVSIGNGECFENARRIFGDSVAKGLWEFSSRNFSRSKQWLTELGVSFVERGALWIGATARERELFVASARAQSPHVSKADTTALRIGARAFEATLQEPGFAVERLSLEKALEKRNAKDGVVADTSSEIIGIDRSGPFEYRVRFRDTMRSSPCKEREIRASVILLVSELLPPPLFPSFADKWLQVTLGSFSCRKPSGTTVPDFSVALFNAGADFAISESTGLRFGSFRNLYEDKAVGIHPQPDPKTLQGVSHFFGDLGWIESEKELEFHISIETLTCDGLPLAGSLPDNPGVYLVTGFAGRAQNYLFEVAEQLAAGILNESGFEALSLFSTKRFL